MWQLALHSPIPLHHSFHYIVRSRAVKVLQGLNLLPCKHVCIAVYTGVSRKSPLRMFVPCPPCPRCLVWEAPWGYFDTTSLINSVQLNNSSVDSVSPLESISTCFTAQLMWGLSYVHRCSNTAQVTGDLITHQSHMSTFRSSDPTLHANLCSIGSGVGTQRCLLSQTGGGIWSYRSP